VPSIGQGAAQKLIDQPIANSHGAGLVFPRVLRRPVRQVQRFFQEGRALSRNSLAVMAVLVIGGAATAGLSKSGKADRLMDEAALLAGFRINDIRISGEHEVSKIDVLSHLDLGPEKSLFSFNVHKARKTLKEISWIHDVTVAKSYPDTLVVSIVERTPFAIWQRGEDLRMIARDGNEITVFEDRFAGLPLVVGPGADDSAADIISLVSRYPSIASRIKAYVRVGSRRWNIVLDNAVTVMLPAQNVEASLVELVALEREFSITERAISRLDLRLNDRITVGLSEDGEIQQEEFVKARLEHKSPGERGI
jgi:cell division protein FtsQ